VVRHRDDVRQGNILEADAIEAGQARWRADPEIAFAILSNRGHRVVGQALYDDLVTDLRPDLAKITVPVTMLYPWDESSGAPQQVFDTLYTGAYASLPNRKVERVDGSYHFIMIDQPAVFLQKVDAFLAG